MDGFDEAEIARSGISHLISRLKLDSFSRAIALSMQESTTSRAKMKGPTEVIDILDDPPEVIVIDDDDEDEASKPLSREDSQFEEDMKRAMEASRAERSTRSPLASTSAVPEQEPEPEPQPSKSSHPFLIDRAQLERERLARQKRLRPDIAHDKPGDDGDEDEDAETAVPKKRQRISTSFPSTSSKPSSSTRQNTVSTSTAAGSSRATGSGSSSRETLFWEGELRQTANAYVDREKDTRPVFRLSEIIGPVRGGAICYRTS